jgi:nucleoid DNA-binding protein
MALTKNEMTSKLTEQTGIDNKTAMQSVEAIIEKSQTKQFSI